MNMLERDAALLRAHNVMDYSLLFAVEKNSNFKGINNPSRGTATTKSEDEEESHLRALRSFDKSRYTFLSKSGRYIYHLSIIDYLQDFNLDKKLENRIKVFINKEGAEISAIEPKGYFTRYLKFMKDEVIIDQKDTSSKDNN